MKNILLFLYIVINVFLYILNFEVFNSQVDIDLGFGIYSLMPIVIVQVIGLLFVSLFYIFGKKEKTKSNFIIDKLEDKVMLLEKDIEIANLKSNNSFINAEVLTEEVNEEK